MSLTVTRIETCLPDSLEQITPQTRGKHSPGTATNQAQRVIVREGNVWGGEVEPVWPGCSLVIRGQTGHDGGSVVPLDVSKLSVGRYRDRPPTGVMMIKKIDCCWFGGPSGQSVDQSTMINQVKSDI